MPEWSIGTVLKTVEGARLSVGSNPTPSAPSAADRTRPDASKALHFHGVAISSQEIGLESFDVSHSASIRHVPPRSVPSGGQMWGKDVRLCVVRPYPSRPGSAARARGRSAVRSGRASRAAVLIVQPDVGIHPEGQGRGRVPGQGLTTLTGALLMARAVM